MSEQPTTEEKKKLTEEELKKARARAARAKAKAKAKAKEKQTKQRSAEFDLAGKKRFEIKKWNAVALWAWDLVVDTCAICRNPLMDLCIEAQANARSMCGDEGCTVAWGVCNHAFHFCCISRWLKTRGVCPLCNTPWDFQKYGK